MVMCDAMSTHCILMMLICDMMCDVMIRWCVMSTHWKQSPTKMRSGWAACGGVCMCVCVCVCVCSVCVRVYVLVAVVCACVDTNIYIVGVYVGYFLCMHGCVMHGCVCTCMGMCNVCVHVRVREHAWVCA